MRPCVSLKVIVKRNKILIVRKIIYLPNLVTKLLLSKTLLIILILEVVFTSAQVNLNLNKPRFHLKRNGFLKVIWRLSSFINLSE